MKNSKKFKPLLKSVEDGLLSGGKALTTDADVYIDPAGFSLKEIDIPITLWHGKCDRNIPISVAREMSSQISKSTLIETEEDGHYSIAVNEIEAVLNNMFMN